MVRGVHSIALHCSLVNYYVPHCRFMRTEYKHERDQEKRRQRFGTLVQRVRGVQHNEMLYFGCQILVENSLV